MSRDAEKVTVEMPPSIDLVVEAVDDLKGADLLVLDVRDVASFTDYLVMCTGSSDRHVQAIVDGIKEKLRSVDRAAAWKLGCWMRSHSAASTEDSGGTMNTASVRPTASQSRHHKRGATAAGTRRPEISTAIP